MNDSPNIVDPVRIAINQSQCGSGQSEDQHGRRTKMTAGTNHKTYSTTLKSNFNNVTLRARLVEPFLIARPRRLPPR